MAEEKVMNSISYYEREHKRIDPRPDNTYYTEGFYQESELKTKDKTNNPPSTPDDALTDESQATSDNGWIAPYDFYKENVHSVNPSRDINNGLIQAEDETSNNIFKFKDQYWWCEDLHNWCIYQTDCITNPYLNSFYLHVWNGLNNWVPAIDSFYVKNTEKFAPLQNKIIKEKIDREETIVMHRGTLKNTPNKWSYSNGPLVINHAWRLKKTETYSVNSENGFQAIRWSTPKHIVNNSEYTEADELMRFSSGTLSFKADISVRQAFAKTNSMWKIFADKDETDPLAPPSNGAFFSKHVMNACDYKTSYPCTFRYPVCKNSGDGDGSVEFIKESQCNSYNHFERNLYWRNNPQNYTNKGMTDEFKKKYGDEYVKSPLNYRICKYNHLLMDSMAMEKIFAVHIYQVGPTGNVLLPNIWINTDAPTEDCRTYDGGTSYPLYMSYVDICMLFFSDVMKEKWNMPGNKDEGDRSVEFTKDGVWKIKNYHLVVTLLSMLQKAQSDPSGADKFFNMEYSSVEKWLAQTIDTFQCSAGYFAVLYQPKAADSSGNLRVIRHEFWRPYARHDKSWGMDDWVAFHVFGNQKNKVPEQLSYSTLMDYTKNSETNAYEIQKTVTYSLETSDSDETTWRTDLANEGKLIEPMVNSMTGNQRIEYIDSMINWPIGYKDFNFNAKEIFKAATSNLREGLSISAPPVYRLPTGDIALCSQLHWAGENKLLGGAGDSSKDSPDQDSVDRANRFVNERCRAYFGSGDKKTIDDHWLKVYNTEMDVSSKDFGLVENQSLQTGYTFEQINNNNTEKLKMTVTTYRPIVITSTSGENVDTAKKW